MGIQGAVRNEEVVEFVDIGDETDEVSRERLVLG